MAAGKDSHTLALWGGFFIFFHFFAVKINCSLFGRFFGLPPTIGANTFTAPNYPPVKSIVYR
jgi:hypothetical protein